MGAMAKMRNSTPIVLWVLIFSFGVLWVLQDTQVFDAVATGPGYLGRVNGDEISLEEYNNRVSYYINQYNEQTSEPLSANMRENLEDQAWEDLIAERLMKQQMERLGITVSDEEVANMILGENPDPFIRQQFADENGQIDRIALRAAIEAPENREIWMMIEQQLRQNRQQQKLSNFLTSGLRVTSSEIEQAYVKENSYADVRYVRFPYSAVADDEIEVTEQDIRDYYDRNRDRFHREETYRFQYVAFDKTPTAEDTLRTRQEVENLRDLFAETENYEDFLQQYQSVTTFRDTYVAADDIREDYQPVRELAVGEVSNVHMIDGAPHIFKKIDERNGEIKFAVFAYRVEADPIATIDRVADEADEFSYFAREDGFQTEADRAGYEIRTATATKGTPVVPQIGEARVLVSELERLRRGRISEPIELSDIFVVAHLTEVVSAGPRPISEVRNQIENTLRNQFRREAAVDRVRETWQRNGSLEELAENLGLEVQVGNNIRYGGTTIPGAGREPGVIGAIFGLDAGETSGVIGGNSAAFVLQVDDLSMADPSQMTREDRERIQMQLEQRKYSMFSNVWIDRLKERAEIRDNRHRLGVR